MVRLLAIDCIGSLQQNQMFSYTTIVVGENVDGSTKSTLDWSSAWNDAPLPSRILVEYLQLVQCFYENFICFAELYAKNDCNMSQLYTNILEPVDT